jgi:peptidoglycan/LPS O-acetylase OafA/YrhL
MTLQRDPEPDSDTPGTVATAPAVDTGRPVALAPDFAVLDTLRFVGAMCVVTTHTGFWTGEYGQHGIWGALIARLDVGVAIFFVLSGFLLFRPQVAAAVSERPRPRTGRYYWKRFLRIYPVYAVTVVLALSLIPENRDIGPAGWLRALLMLDSFVSDLLPEALTQMWSLAVEATFYLVLPLLAVLVFGRGVPRVHPSRFVTVLLGMLAVSVTWHLWLGQELSGRVSGVPMTWLPAYLTWFAVGLALAFVHVRLQEGQGGAVARFCASLGGMPGACWAAVAGLMLVAATPLVGPTQLFVASPAESVTKHLLYGAIGGLVVLTGVFAAPSGSYTRTMSHPLLRHLGHISYSVFCLHLPVLYFIFEWGDYELFRGHGLEVWAATVTVTLVLSELAYRLVERPAQRLRGVSPRRRPSGGSQPTASAQADTTSS